jgi:ComF family protein
MDTSLKSIANDLLSFIFPSVCGVCAEPLTRQEQSVCMRCLYEMPLTNYHLQPDNELVQKFWGRLPVSHAVACYRFSQGNKVQQLLHSLKYRNQAEIGEVVGRLYGKMLQQSGFAQHFDALVPVPLHASKLQARGYNQAAHFAAGLSESLALPHYPEALIRRKATLTQTRKGRTDRWDNVSGIFAVNPQYAAGIAGKRILLADDVITTGATTEACLSALQAAGCPQTGVCAIALAV